MNVSSIIGLKVVLVARNSIETVIAGAACCVSLHTAGGKQQAWIMFCSAPPSPRFRDVVLRGKPCSDPSMFSRFSRGWVPFQALEYKPVVTDRQRTQFQMCSCVGQPSTNPLSDFSCMGIGELSELHTERLNGHGEGKGSNKEKEQNEQNSSLLCDGHSVLFPHPV